MLDDHWKIQGILMAIIFRSDVSITKGFEAWQKFVYANRKNLQEMGVSFLFAGTEKNNPSQLISIIRFDNVKTVKKFITDISLREASHKAGIIIESEVLTYIPNKEFINCS